MQKRHKNREKNVLRTRTLRYYVLISQLGDRRKKHSGLSKAHYAKARKSLKVTGTTETNEY